MLNSEDITYPTTAMNMALGLMAKAFKLNYSTPTNNNQRISSNPRNRQIAQPGNLNGYNVVQNVRNQGAQNAIQNPRIQNVRNQNGQTVVLGTNQILNGNGNLIAARAEGNATGYNGNQIRCYNCRGVGHFARNCTARPRRRDAAYLQTQLLTDLDEIEEVNANYILMANLQQASTSGTRINKALVYDSDGSAEVHNYEDCCDNDVFNMFTQEEQYTKILEPILELHQVPHNDNNVISEVTSVEKSKETIEQHPVNVKETRVLYDSLYHNLAIKVEKVNTVNRKLKKTNAELTTELARFKNQEKCFEISQEKHDKLERCHQQSVYQEQCLFKKINALHLSFGKQIMTLNEKISDLNKQLSKEKSTVTFLLEEKKKLKSDFKIREDELLDKQIQLEKRIKELDNILVKMGQSIQTIHMLSPKPDSFYHTEQKMALEETLQLAQESHLKMKHLNKEIKPANYTKINHLLGEFSDDTTPSVARKFLNEVKSTIVTLQRVVKHRMTLETHNWSSSTHQELHNIVKDESFPIVNQVDARVQIFGIQFLKEAAKFVGDFKSLEKEADESLAKQKALELEIERLLRAVVSQDIMSVVQNNSVSETSNLQIELERMKERFENCIIKKENEYAKLWNDRINPFKNFREERHVPNKVRGSDRTKSITVSQPTVFTKKYVNSDSNGLSSTGIDNTKTRRPQPRSNTKNDRVPSASKNSCNKNKGVEVEEPHRNLLLSKNKKHMSSACNNVKIDSQNVKYKVVCAMCKQSLISVNHDVCLLNYVNGKTSRGKKQKFLGTVCFENDHVAAILGFGDFQWGNILITGVYFVEGLGHNLFSVGQFCDSDLEVTFRRNACFIKNLEGVDLLSGNHTTNLYTINLHDMASASPIFLIARASSTKLWLWHQRLSHLNFDTINDLAKNDIVSGLPKFKYHKEHLCFSCEQGKSKRASHPPKPVPNSRQRLHLLHMDLCGPKRISSINGKRNRTLVEATRTMLIFSRASIFLWAEVIATACFTQNRSIIHRRFNKTPYELINDRKPDIFFLYVFGALCYPKNDREDIGKLGAKGDIGLFIGYSANTRAYIIYNRRTKKIMETMNVSFDELSVMAFEQRSSKSMTSGQISSALDLTYALLTITTQQPTEDELDLLFEAMYNDYVCGQPSAA
uniref:Integrase, catalytic region, zinc finger, CCHC-type, peptidase aspartic, catalytic n=1 Tax=Tanacetum cinerariifolium TaxID=118510 RepID=A0A6L2JFY3_TANCI|nr:integrase, catalytic region, zinc finger, CCHC-type, peptidase aspartic, catalytic [Tanacetum cinerariifolium]